MIQIKNEIDNTIDIYVYGAIEKYKWDDSDVTFEDFKNKLENKKNKIINLYINSPGGSVTVTQGIVAFLQRIKKDNRIDAYIDGLGASCASILPMIADRIYMYKTSLLMIHKPWTFAYGNANDLQNTVEVLDKIENGVMYPLYEEKLKDGVKIEEIKALVDKETWLTAQETAELFDVEIIEDEKDISACVGDDESILAIKSFKNAPKNIKDLLNKKNKTKEKDLLNKKNEKVEKINKAKAKLALKIKILGGLNG